LFAIASIAVQHMGQVGGNFGVDSSLILVFYPLRCGGATISRSFVSRACIR
jgi:hypothetical protein